jgi:hypothetical protein
MREVLAEVQHAFVGLCVESGKQMLAQMMELDRVALCGAKGVPTPSAATCAAVTRTVR